MSPPKSILDMVHFDVLSVQHINLSVTVNYELKKNKVWMGVIEQEGCIIWLKGESSNPFLFEKGCSIFTWFFHHFINWGGIFCNKWCTPEEA